MDGILLVTVGIPPNVNDVLYPTPLIVPTPTDSLGLKNTLSFTLESNLSTDLEIVKEFGEKVTAVPTVCDTPTNPLSILRIFWFLNTSRTFKVSAPILILLPTDTWSGIGET